MTHPILKSETTNQRQSITIKKMRTLEQYKEIVYLTKDYYKHLLLEKHPKPLRKLPDLELLLEAKTVVDAYVENCNKGLSLKMYNSTLSVEKVVAVWAFVNEPTLNIKLGNYQMFVIKHQ